MLPIGQYSPRVHDLLLLRSGVLGSAGVAKPAWVSSSRAGNLWVVVRRANAPDGHGAAGIRGIHRHQRWGGFVDLADVKQRLRPSQLSSCMARSTRLALPVLAALSWLERQLCRLDLEWGPVGSVGFELATGRQVINATSDLDLALFAPKRFTRAAGRALWSVMSAAQAKVDVLVETPYCGFSLEEFARETTEQALVRLPTGRRFAADPWAISLAEDAE